MAKQNETGKRASPSTILGDLCPLKKKKGKAGSANLTSRSARSVRKGARESHQGIGRHGKWKGGKRLGSSLRSQLQNIVQLDVAGHRINNLKRLEENIASGVLRRRLRVKEGNEAIKKERSLNQDCIENVDTTVKPGKGDLGVTFLVGAVG